MTELLSYGVNEMCRSWSVGLSKQKHIGQPQYAPKPRESAGHTNKRGRSKAGRRFMTSELRPMKAEALLYTHRVRNDQETHNGPQSHRRKYVALGHLQWRDFRSASAKPRQYVELSTRESI